MKAKKTKYGNRTRIALIKLIFIDFLIPKLQFGNALGNLSRDESPDTTE